MYGSVFYGGTGYGLVASGGAVFETVAVRRIVIPATARTVTVEAPRRVVLVPADRENL